MLKYTVITESEHKTNEFQYLYSSLRVIEFCAYVYRIFAKELNGSFSP
jgi:hypothetical protein